MKLAADATYQQETGLFDIQVENICNLCKKAWDEATPIQRIYEEVLNTLNREEAAIYTVLNLVLQTQKKEYPALPLTLSDVDINGVWTPTKDGRCFLCIDDDDTDNTLVFATTETVTHDQQALYMDGMFYACPHLWHQLYIIHAIDCIKDVSSYLQAYARPTPRNLLSTVQRNQEVCGEQDQKTLNS